VCVCVCVCVHGCMCAMCVFVLCVEMGIHTVNNERLVKLKFGEFGKSQAIRQTKIIQTLHYVIIIINSQCHSPNLLRTEFAELSTKLLSFTVNILHTYTSML